MTPLLILKDIVEIAKLIHAQVMVAQSNKLKLRDLSATMQRVISSIEGLATLPNNQQFIESLTALQACLHAAHVSLQKFSASTKLAQFDRFLYAKTYAGQIDGFKASILELVPLLNIGLAAQQLMDRDRDRRHEEADRLEQMAMQETYFREMQARQLKEADLAQIVRQQMASLEARLAQKNQSPEKLSEKSTLPKELMANFSDIEFHTKIANSDIGVLYHGTWKDQPVTIKWLERLESEEDHHLFRREAHVMSKLHNEYITPFYGACFEKTGLCLLMGVMEKGTLDQVLATLNEPERLRMAQDLARGLAYLHHHDMIHGDIAPSHIGVNRYNQAKWTDFGLVKTRATSLASVMTVNQNVRWQAPESWRRRAELTTASDIYSFGLLLWTLATGKAPYTTIPTIEIMTRVKAGFREAIPSHLSPEFIRLIESCWSADPAARLSARELAQQLQTVSLMTPRISSPTGEALYQQASHAQETGRITDAYTLFHRSCDKGYAKAFTSIGLFKLQGLGGCSVDKKAAVAYLERAAEKGHARAMFNLGRMYEKGDIEAGRPNFSTALHWYQQALNAEPSDTRCQEKVTALTALLRNEDSIYRFATNLK